MKGAGARRMPKIDMHHIGAIRSNKNRGLILAPKNNGGRRCRISASRGPSRFVRRFGIKF